MTQDKHTCDVAVIGGGPGGAAAAIRAAEAGLSVTVLERDAFPRYHVGESLTGVAGNLLRDLGLGPAMADAGFPVKSGVKVLGRKGNEYFVPVLCPTWQVRRDHFDSVLLDRARKAGAQVVRARATGVISDAGRVRGLHYRERSGEDGELHANAVIDASGTACFLSREGIAGAREYDTFGNQVAFFSQVRNAARDPGEMGDNTFIFYAKTHHWAWFIPLSNELVSVGVVVPRDEFRRQGADPKRTFDWGLEHIHPQLWERVQGREWTEPIRAIRDYSYRLTPFAGPGFLCVGDAHRFADPIFSFGVTASMLEGMAAVDAVLRVASGETWNEAIAPYVRYSDTGQDAIHDFIEYFWTYPGFFGVQMRSRLRKEVIRLFGGDIFQPNQVVDQIRSLMREGAARPALSPAD